MIVKSIKDQTDCEHIESIVNFIDRVKSIPSAEMNNRTYQNQIQATSNAQLLQQELIDEQAAVVPYQASYLHPSSTPGTPAPIYYSSPYSNPPMTSLGATPMTSQITPGLMMPMIPSTTKQPSMSTNSMSTNSVSTNSMSTNSVSPNSIPVTSSSICVPSTSTSLQNTNPKVINSSTNPFSSNWKSNYVTITDTSAPAPVLDPNAFSKLETEAFDWFKKDEKVEKASSPPKKLELETEKPVSYLSEQMKNSKLENLDPWVTFESPTKSSPPSTFPVMAPSSPTTNNLKTTNPTVSDTKLNPSSAPLTKPAPPPIATVTAMPVSKPMTTMTKMATHNVPITSVTNPVINSSKKPEMVKTQTVSTPAPMQIYTTIESTNSTQSSTPKMAVSKAPVVSTAPPNRSPNSIVQPSKMQTQNYGVYGHIPSTQKSPKQPNIALMASDDAVNLLRQKYGLAPTKKVTETQATASSRPVGGTSVNSNGIEKDIFARKPTRSSLTDQKMVDAKAQILVNQFSNTITKEQASFVLSENNMDVKKAIKSIKVRFSPMLG